MKFKNLRQLTDEMINMVEHVGPNFNLEPDGHIYSLAEDVALLITDIQGELNSLRWQYNIAEKDLLPFVAVLQRGVSIPARNMGRIMGDKNE